MKLLNLYIENFGGLHQFTLDFEEGITSVIQPNGFGKTTENCKDSFDYAGGQSLSEGPHRVS